MLLHAPDELIDAILSEERLAPEYHHRNTPMPSFPLIALVLLDHRAVAVGVIVNGLRQFVIVEAGAFGRLSQMVAFMPVVDFAGPDNVTDFSQERQRAAPFSRGNPKMGEPMNIRLFNAIVPGHHADGIGPGPSVGQAEKLGLTGRVA